MIDQRLPPFPDFVEEHRVRVYRFLVAAVGPVEADDCFQETFLAALRAYPKLEHAEALDRWILKIATRKALDHHRGRGRRPVPSESAIELADARPATTKADGIDPADPLWDAVRALPPRQRAAVVHRYVLDLPYDQVGDLMGCSAETARANVHHGMRTLREEVEADA